MPHSDLHKKKLSKNLIVLAMIVGFMVLIWMITMVKMARADELKRDPMTAKRTVDSVTSYIESREEHIAAQEGNPEHWWYDDLLVGIYNSEGALSNKDGDDNRALDPTKLQNERKLRNTFNHNRSVGSNSTVTP